MKKLYSLFILLVGSLSFAQGSINFDDAAKWTQGTLAFTGYSNHSYADGVFSLACTDVVRNTTAAQDGFPGALGTYSLRLQNDATTDVTMTVSTGGIGTFSFKARRWDASPVVDYTVEYSIDGGTNWTSSSIIDATVTTDSDWKTVNGVVNSSNANVKVRIRGNSAGERLMVDDFSWTSPSTDPLLLITSPSNGTIYAPTTSSVTVNLSVFNFTVANGTGTGHIHYTVDGGAVVMKYDTAPIVLSGLNPGSHTVNMFLVNNSHAPLSPAVNATVQFTIASFTTVADIAALRADVIANGYGKYYQLTSSPVVSYKRTARNQKYVQDASAGMLIDDVPGTITTAVVDGDALSGLQGQSFNFSGVLEFLPIANANVVSSGNVITPQVVTAAAIAANIDAYESKLVQINGATFALGDGTATFASNTDYTVNADATILFRTMFTEVDYLTAPNNVIPMGAKNIIVLVSENNGVAKVVARNLANLTLAKDSFNAISGLTVYPNPVKNGVFYINSDANAVRTVTVYDVVGKQVLNTTTSNSAVNVSSLNAGIYMVKITEEGKTATRKLVIE